MFKLDKLRVKIAQMLQIFEIKQTQSLKLHRCKSISSIVLLNRIQYNRKLNLVH